MIDIKRQEETLINLAKQLKRRITVYAVGGTAMMFHGFKDVTLDIDLVFLDEKDRKEFKEAAEKIGYINYDSVKVYGIKPNRPIMLSRGKGADEERFDLFKTEVIHFIFSDNMTSRADSNTHEFNAKLILKISDPHDIILMKCATDRLKDKEDIREIIKKFKINWDIIIEEAKNQVKIGKERAIWDLLECVKTLKKMGVDIPKDVPNKLSQLLHEQINSKEN